MRAIDSGEVCALVLLDLSSAFDMVDHDTLLRMLTHRFGVNGPALTWFSSYLSGRTQAYHHDDLQSQPYAVGCSVPQGSVLGPQEFIAYTEDLAELIDGFNLSHHLYADDTQLLKRTRIDDTGSTIDRLQQCIKAIHGWCSSRRLQLNPSKTEVIWFGTKTSLKRMENIDLTQHVGNDVIGSASSVRDLGVILDCELSMKKHISKVTSVCYYHLRRLKTVRRILGEKTTASLVQAFVISRLDYCNSILAGLPKSSIVPLQRVQNVAARLIRALGPRDHVTSTMRDLHWLPLEQRIIYKLCSLMHLVNTGHSPQYLQELVTLTSDIPSRSRLRSAGNRRYETPATRLKIGERCFSFAGPAAWNSLPAALHDIRDHRVFKRYLKTELFNRVYTT